MTNKKAELLANLPTQLPPTLTKAFLEFDKRAPTVGHEKRYKMICSLRELWRQEIGSTMRYPHQVIAQFTRTHTASELNYLFSVGNCAEGRGRNPAAKKDFYIVWQSLDEGLMVLSTMNTLLSLVKRFQLMSRMDWASSFQHVSQKVAANTQGVWSDRFQLELENEAIELSSRTVESAPERSGEARRSGSRKRKPKPNGNGHVHDPVADKLRTDVFNWLDSQLTDIPEIRRIDLRQTYRHEFKVWLDRLRRAVLLYHSPLVVDRNSIAKAYETLGVLLPKSGESIDIRLLKAAFRRLCLETHPDRGGTQATFTLVLDSFNYLEDLHRQHKGILP
jgi:hypothetical protein